MSRFPLALMVGALLMLFAEQASAQQAPAQGRRVALVIGVSAYESVPKLPNAVNDATAIAEMFRSAGFDVVTARNDVGNLALKRAIREFEDAVVDADIAVVYYAGHGIEIREQNYLIPTDAKLVNERDADDEAIALDRVITALEPAKRLRLIILDACRDNPFASKIKRRVATRAITAGLARVEPSQTDTLIAYAAKEKAVANDGDGAHSPFTTALLSNLTVPGLDVRLAFGRVRDDVLRATRRQQEPFVYGSLGGGTVALVPAAAEVKVPAAPRLDVDLAKSDYEIVERVGKKEAWEVFLNTHKTGLYADLARVQLAKLGEIGGLVRSDAPGGLLPNRDTTRDTPKVEAPAIQSPPKPGAAEQRAWDKLKASSDQAAIRRFLSDYPASPLAPVAQERLETLERLARQREETLRIEREAARQKDEDEKQRKAAEAERVRIEKEAARQKEEETRARMAEAARQKAEALAAARQHEAEEKARAAEALAKRREEEEQVKAAALAERQRQAEERARAAEVERRQAEREAADRRRELEESARVAAAAKAVREAEEKARRAEAEEARKSDAAKAAEIASRQRREAEEKAREIKEAARAAEIASRQRQAEDRAKVAEAVRQSAERDAAAKQREAAERAKVSDGERLKERASADAERRKAQAAAEEAAERRAEHAAAARRREAAEEARRDSAEEAAANRRRAAEISRRASERQAERAAAVADQRRQAERAASASAQRRRAAQARPAPAPRVRAEAAARPAPRASGGGGGAPTLVGIGF